MVPRLPPEPGTIRASARPGLQRQLRPTAEPARTREAAGGRVSHSEAHELFDMSSMSEETRRDSGLGARTQREGWWRTLEERAEDPAFQEHLYNEFPSEIEAIADPVARRTFLKLMGASMALAGVT